MNFEDKDIESFGWANSVKRFWFTALGLLTYGFTHLADRALEIVGKGIVLVVPIPNAISVFYLSQKHVGFNFWQALGWAIGIEVVVFFMVGISLQLLGAWLNYEEKRFLVTFMIMTGGTVLVIGAVVVFIYYLETISGGHTILALVPIFSIGAFVGLGFKDWLQIQPEIMRRNATKNRPITKKSEAQAAVKTTGDQGLTVEQLQWLHENPNSKAKAIAEHMGVGKSTVFRKLQPYIDEGIIIAEQVGQSYLYRLSPDFKLPQLAKEEIGTNGHSVVIA